MARPEDQQTGVATPLASFYTNFATFRWAQTQNAMLYGPTRVNGQGFLRRTGKSFFSWRATEEEMTNWRAGTSIGGRTLGRIPMGGGNVNQMYGSWLNSPFALSKWTSAAQLMDRPDIFSRDASRMFSRLGYMAQSPAKRAAVGGKHAAKIAEFEKNRMPIGGRPMTVKDYAMASDAAYASAWTAQALHFGEEYLGQNSALHPIAQSVRNYTTGLMFKPTSEIIRRDSAYAARMAKLGFEKYTGSSKVLNAINEAQEAGATVIGYGEKVGFDLTKLGSAVGGVSKLAGNALAAYTIYQNTRLIGEGVYNLGSLALYKPARRAFQDLGAIGERRMFAPTGPQGWIASPTASSNRARAVQAIQGSKLNARSALGNEASLLAGHFG